MVERDVVARWVTRLPAIAIAALLTSASFEAAAAKPDVTFELAVAVATDNGMPVQDEAWLAEQTGNAERLFGELGVHFKRTPSRSIAQTFAHLVTRADRDALAGEEKPGRINVFVVDSLVDVDEPPRMRMGVHWRPVKKPNAHYVIVVRTALPTTLAHELGHFFGNGHSQTVNNLMSYLRTTDQVFLDETQGKKIQTFAQIYLRSKELLPLTP